MLLFEKDFNKEFFNSVLKEISLNLHENCELLISEPFTIHEMLPKLSDDHITTIAEILLQNVIEENNLKVIDYISDNKILGQALLHLCLMKINKQLKQKKKNDEIDDSNLVSSKIISFINKDDCESGLKHMLTVFNEEFEKQSSYSCIKYKEEKVMAYLNVIKKLPVLYMSNVTKTVLFMYLSSVILDLKLHNSTSEKLLNDIESILIGKLSDHNIYIHTYTHAF